MERWGKRVDQEMLVYEREGGIVMGNGKEKEKGIGIGIRIRGKGRVT